MTIFQKVKEFKSKPLLQFIAFICCPVHFIFAFKTIPQSDPASDQVAKKSLAQKHEEFRHADYFFKIAVFRYQSHTIKFTLLKYKIQWTLEYEQLCNHHHNHILEHFHHLKKKPRTHRQSFPTPSPQIVWQRLSYCTDLPTWLLDIL